MNLFGQELLVLVVFLPLAGALLLALLPGKEAGQHRILALVTSILTFAASLMILGRFETGVAGFQESLTVDAAWIATLDVRFHLGLDGISLWLVLLTTFLMPLVILGTWSAVTERTKEFMIAVLVLETAMLGSFVALDLVLFYVFWEAMLIPMYLLIGVFGGARRIYSAFKFFLYTMIGSLLMLLAMLYIYYQYGSFDLRNLLAAEIPLSEQRWLFWAFVLAFAVKVPLFPVHTWLPDAHVEAPTAGSVILAAVLLKMGTYGLMRFAFPLFPDAAVIFAPTLAVLAVVGIVYGALMAIAQHDIKKLIAYSSVSHMGFVVLGLCALTPTGATGAVYQMLAHGLATGALFLLVGVIYERRHTRLISDFGGIAKVMPVFAALFLLVTLGSIGLPGTSGFIGEFLILLGTFTASPPWAKGMAAVAATGVVLGAIYMLWMYRRVFFGPLSGSENAKLKDLSFRELVVVAPLCFFILLMGVYPKPFLERITPSVDTYVGRVLNVAAPETHRTAHVALAAGETQAAIAPEADIPVPLGPGRPAVATQNAELTRVRAAAYAWHRPEDRPRPRPFVMPPEAGRRRPAPQPPGARPQPPVRPDLPALERLPDDLRERLRRQQIPRRQPPTAPPPSPEGTP
jgi:NADH-quinone oxidoreductase subunit M